MYLWVIGEIVLEYVLHIFRKDSVSDGEIRKVHMKCRRVFQIGGTPVMQPVIVPQNLYNNTHKRPTNRPSSPPLCRHNCSTTQKATKLLIVDGDWGKALWMVSFAFSLICFLQVMGDGVVIVTLYFNGV
jgi:hypothetical protein